MKDLKKFRLGFLASGGGSNFENIVNKCKSGYLKSEPTVLVCNNRDAKVFEKSDRLGIPSFHISAKTEGSHEKAMEKITKIMHEKGVDLIILAGYMKLVCKPLVEEYRDKILNIHPGLLPQFGGVGYYGEKVHKQVIDNKAAETGATVHLVDEIYDHGRILGYLKLPVRSGETSEELAQRVLELEHLLYPSVIRDIENGKIII